MPTLTVNFTFASTAQGFVATAGDVSVTMVWTAASGNPAGSLRSTVVGKNAGGANHWDLTTTYEALGVPVNSTITAIQAASLDSLCSIFTNGDALLNWSGPATLTDGATVATLTPVRPFSATDGAWSTDGGTDLTGLSLPSSNSISLRINNQLDTLGTGSPQVQINQDNLTFQLAYVVQAATVGLGVRSRVGARAIGQIGRPGPVTPGKSVFWQFSVDQLRAQDVNQCTGSGAVTLGALDTTGSSATFVDTGPHGIAPRVAPFSPGQIGRPGPVTPGKSVFWDWHITPIYAASSFIVSGSGGITLGALTAAGIAIDTSTATGGITLGGLTVSGAAVFTSTAVVSPTINLAGLTVAGVAKDTATSTGPITLGSLIVAGVASDTSTSTGTITLGSLTVAGVANFLTSGGGVIPRLGASSRGHPGRPGPMRPGHSVFWKYRSEPIYASDRFMTAGGGGLTLTGLTVAGIATDTSTSTGAITLGALTVAGAANTNISATGAITLGSLTAAGVSTQSSVATAPVLLGSLIVASATAFTSTSSGAITLGSLIVAGVGRLSDSATGAITLGSLIVAGVASTSDAASGAITLGSLIVSGAGDATSTGTTGFGAITLGSLTAAGVAGITATSTGVITLDPLFVAGVATASSVAAANDVLLAGLIVAGVATVSILPNSTGAGTITLSPLVVAGSAALTARGTAPITLGPLVVAGLAVCSGGDLSIKAYTEPRLGTVLDEPGTIAGLDPRAGTIATP